MDNNIEKRIQALEQWRKEKETQQIKFPLDNASITILNKYFMSIIGDLSYTNPSGIEFTSWLVRQGQYTGILGVGFPLFRYTVDPTTDVFTAGIDIANGVQGDFADDTQVLISFLNNGAPPSPLQPNILYYVVNSTGTTFQLSLSLGGAAIDITTAGTGEQFIESVN